MHVCQRVLHRSLEAEPLVDRGGLWRAPIRHEGEGLKVVGVTLHGVRKIAKGGRILELYLIAILQESTGIIAALDGVIRKWIVHPLADFMRQRGNILRKGTGIVDER